MSVDDALTSEVEAPGPRIRARAQQLRFTRLKLTNWRNFRQIEVALEARAFLVGPNASGKSNLLDAFRFLAELANPGSGGLQAALKKRGGFTALRCLHARRPSDVELDVTIGDNRDLAVWRYVLKINVAKRGQLPSIVAERVEQHGKVIVDRSAKTEDSVELSQTTLEQVSLNKRIPALVDFFASCRYLHVVPQIVRDRARAKPEGDDPYGGDLLRRMKQMTTKMRSPRLVRISTALAIAVPQFESITLEDDTEGVPHLQARFQHWRKGPSKQSEDSFSDGTLRLIGLLWSIAERGGPLLLEEPELSLNDAVVSELPKMFQHMQRLSGRQVIVTTHSSSLIDESTVGLKEIHRISVDSNGSSVETAFLNQKIKSQVDGGMTASEAIFPLLRPRNIDSLGQLNVAAGN